MELYNEKDEKNKIFEIVSSRSLINPSASKTILSLNGSPIIQFNDDPENEKRMMDVNLTDLMILFDDFDEISDNESLSSTLYNFWIHSRRVAASS